MAKTESFSEEKLGFFPREKSFVLSAESLLMIDLLAKNSDFPSGESVHSPRDEWFSLYKKEYAKFLKAEPVPEIIAKTPPPKVKRVFTESEKQALSELIQLGADGLDEFSSNDDIKKAFRTLAKRYHPDSLVGQSDSIIREKSRQFMRIHSCYKALVG